MVKVVQVSMTDNPFLDPESINSFLLRLSPEERAAREHGQFVVMGGLIFPNFDITKHVIDPLLQPNKDNLWVVGLDSGFNNPTAVLWTMFDKDGKCIVFDEFYHSGYTTEMTSMAIKEKNRAWNRNPDFYTGDPAIAQKSTLTGTSVHQEYARNGIPIVLSNNSVVPGINRIHEYLQPAPITVGTEVLTKPPLIQITSNCKMLIWEMQKYKWATFSKRVARDKALQEKPHKKDDHAVDALRYVLMSRPSPRAIVPTAKELVRESEMAGARTVASDYDERLQRERMGIAKTRWQGQEDLLEWD